MLNRISHTGVWVTDQDEALAFYRDKLGFEVRVDVTMPEFGNMRWLSVALPGQDVVLQLQAFDGQPMDETSRGQVADLLAKGYNPPLVFQVDDCRATIEQLRERGVDISQEPADEFYGVDAGIRDPSGNSIRITQLAPVPV
ncbi:MAG TPA: VOC family protein [Solirubrobacteraceae bacterium]|jgi:catechol 2,3-dioxygenase-like lactoylglutathione lyase family enzyme